MPLLCPRFSLTGWICCAVILIPLSGCGGLSRGDTQSPGSTRGRQESPTTVDVAIARSMPLDRAVEYTGTTLPLKEVSLRAQVEGQILKLTVDVGDRVQRGQSLVQVDDAILTTLVIAAEAELASRQSEVIRLRTQVTEAKTRVEQTRLQFQQSEADAARLENLARDGAISQQAAEQARTTARTADQVLKSAAEQVKNQQEAIAAAEKRVTAQIAVVAQARQRRAFSNLTAPLTGSVTARTSEVGNLVQPGSEILRLGDFSRIKVITQLSERELADIQAGSPATVRLDALPKQTFSGTVSRISPAADPTARLVPVEIILPNPNQQIGSGLLARVRFETSKAGQIVVPAAAIQNANRPAPDRSPVDQGERRPKTEGIVFVVKGDEKQATVEKRQVKLGDRADDRVQVLSGLASGERFVIRSGKPLKDGESVRFSILSEL